MTSPRRSAGSRAAKVSHVYGMSWCRCTTPLGKPVEPPLNSQKAMSSGWVSAGSVSPGASASSASNCDARHRALGQPLEQRVLGDDQLRVAVARVVGEVLGRVEEARRARGRRPMRIAPRNSAGTSACRRGPSARGPRGRRRARRSTLPAAQIALVQLRVGDLVAARSGSRPCRRRPASSRRSTSVPEFFTAGDRINATDPRTVRIFTSITPLGVSRISGRKSPHANSRLYSGSWNG